MDGEMKKACFTAGAAIRAQIEHERRRRLAAATAGKERPVCPGGAFEPLPSYLETPHPRGMPAALRLHLAEYRRSHNAHPATVLCSRATFWEMAREAWANVETGDFRVIDPEASFGEGSEIAGVVITECEALPFGALASPPPA
jgi:hypothetical protein